MELEFGKFKGRGIGDPYVPTSYLRWLCDKMMEDCIALTDELERRRQLEDDDRTIVEAIIEAGYSALQQRHEAEGADARTRLETRGAESVLRDVVKEYFWKHGPGRRAQRRDERIKVRNVEQARAIMRDRHAPKDEREWAEKILAEEEN